MIAGSARRRQVALVARIALVAVAIAAAYHYSIWTLLRDLTLDTPLSYLGLVPVLAIALVVVKGRNRDPELDVHDRHVDYIVGLPLLATAITMQILLPVHLSTFFWLWRVDLLSPPLFVGGAIALVFGVRVLWRLKIPLLFLLLAWPVPYALALGPVTNAFSEMTLAALGQVVGVLPLAQAIPGQPGVFSIPNSAGDFAVSVGAACTGVDGVVGFLLVGVAFGAVVKGNLPARAGWLGIGLVVVWSLNVLRLIALFAIGRRFGEAVAIDWIHPIAGLVIFNAGVLLMVLALPRFGLSLGSSSRRRDRVVKAPAITHRGTLVVQRAAVALCVLLLLAVPAAAADHQLGHYQLVADDLGAPRLSDVSLGSAQVAGWSLAQVDSFSWAHQYFGPSSTWARYEYDWVDLTNSETSFQSSEPIVMDVISTSDLSAFSVYSLEDCYRFHNFNVVDARSISLGAGVTAHALTYYDPADDSDWLAVYWEWPVISGQQVTYQRVVINMFNPDPATLRAPPLTANLAADAGYALDDALGGVQSRQLPGDLSRARDFLIGFAQLVIAAAATEH